jgi:hypothetical protein
MILPSEEITIPVAWVGWAFMLLFLLAACVFAGLGLYHRLRYRWLRRRFLREAEAAFEAHSIPGKVVSCEVHHVEPGRVPTIELVTRDRS